MLADIIVRDPVVIDEIKSGAKRQISSGYSCTYVEKDGKYYQKDIIGNHVALVQAGRAGNNVRIYDSKSVNVNRYNLVKKLQKAIKACSI